MPADVATLPPVGPDDVAVHLVERHAVAPVVLAGVDVEDVLGWHAAEHKHRTPSTTKEGLEKNRHAGHLRHLHGEAA